MSQEQQDIRARLHDEGAIFRPVRAAYDRQRLHIRALIVEACAVGIPQTEICETTGYTRENVRQIMRADELKQAREVARRAAAQLP